MSDKCPYCYSNLGTWSNDPLLISNGSKYIWASDTTLSEVSNIEERFYRGLSNICRQHLEELQSNRKGLEILNLSAGQHTTFSPINNTGYFQVTGQHIRELRESTEKLLTVLGVTKQEYFNYDIDNNHIIHPNGDKTNWTDNILINNDWDKFQVKAIHIEDLRHPIPTQTPISQWLEDWSVTNDFSNAGSRIDIHGGYQENYQKGIDGDLGGLYWFTVFDSRIGRHGVGSQTITWLSNMNNHIYNMKVSAKSISSNYGNGVAESGGKVEAGIEYPSFFLKHNEIINPNTIFLKLIGNTSLTRKSSASSQLAYSECSLLLGLLFWNHGEYVMTDENIRFLELYQGDNAKPWANIWNNNLSFEEQDSYFYSSKQLNLLSFNTPMNLTSLIYNNFTDKFNSCDYCQITEFRLGVYTKAQTGTGFYIPSGSSKTTATVNLDTIFLYQVEVEE